MSLCDGASPSYSLDRPRADVIRKPAGEGLEELEYLARLLEDALWTLADRPWRAAWRLADAGGRLRRVLEAGGPERCGPAGQDATGRPWVDSRTGRPHVVGLDVPSGLGCVLPRIPDGAGGAP
jgi:hypothetical protein